LACVQVRSQLCPNQAGIDLLLCSARSQVYSTDAFTRIGILLPQKRAVVVKSTQHFYASFAPIAADILYVATPGALSPDYARLPYTRRDPNFWPRVADPFQQ
jgi:microcystin degradation protein MlrC